MTAETLHVTPAPDDDTLARLAPDVAGVRATWERGEDAHGRARLVLRLAGDDEASVAAARRAWLDALAAEGFRAFVV